MKKNEIEIKIELTQKEFKKIMPDFDDAVFEKTFGYFKEDFSNIQEGIFPRIKYIIKNNSSEIVLTVKRKIKENANFFEREETEINIIKDANIKLEGMREIFKALQFTKEIIFEKKRKNIIKDDIVISLDELPFGFFIEFEGSPEKIEKYLKEFNLLDRERLTKAYLGLWEDYKVKLGINDQDCLFK